MTDSKWLVYIVRCIDGSLYTGVTTDLGKRLRRHNAGLASKYTRSRRPVALVHWEEQPTKGLALKREAAIKGLTKAQKEELINAVDSTS